MTRVQTLVAAGMLTMPLHAQLQASLTAVTPIVASWVNAPPGTVGATVTVPAGPLTSANISAPVGTTWATFLCALTNPNGTWLLSANSDVDQPFSQLVGTQADLLLQVTAPTPTVVAVLVQLSHVGDTPSASGFRVDIGNDGSFEADTFSFACCGTNRIYATTAVVSGPLSVRITNGNGNPFSPQGYDLRLTIEPWLPTAVPTAAECSGTVYAPFPGLMFYTNYQLTALPSTAPQTLSVLRANGLGAFALFLVSDLATALPLQLPPPFVGACDVLSNVVIVDPGTPLSASPFGEWEVVVPTLPPGLSLHVQHASANATAPFWFGATNRLRIDT